MSRDDPLFKLRIPETLKARVEASARASGRSATAEINLRVEASYEIGEKLSQIDAKLDQLISRMDASGKPEPKA